MDRTREFIDKQDHLRVPVASSWDRAPVRPGWTPFFVSVILTDQVPKVFVYKRNETATAAAAVRDGRD